MPKRRRLKLRGLFRKREKKRPVVLAREGKKTEKYLLPSFSLSLDLYRGKTFAAHLKPLKPLSSLSLELGSSAPPSQNC